MSCILKGRSRTFKGQWKKEKKLRDQGMKTQCFQLRRTGSGVGVHNCYHVLSRKKKKKKNQHNFSTRKVIKLILPQDKRNWHHALTAWELLLRLRNHPAKLNYLDLQGNAYYAYLLIDAKIVCTKTNNIVTLTVFFPFGILHSVIVIASAIRGSLL